MNFWRFSQQYSYKNIDEMWQKELQTEDTGDVKNPIGSKDNWYNKAAEYWEVI